MAKILIVDDEPNITLSFSSLLRDEKYQTACAGSAEEAARLIERTDFALMLLDLNLPGQSGIELLRQLREDPDVPPVLVISGQSDIPTALEAVRLGAIDYLEKPVAPEKLISSVRAALMLGEARRQRNLIVDDLDAKSQILGHSKPLMRMLRDIERIARTDSTVLVVGENGTGKELVATRLYLQSKRRSKPFVKVNCPGIPANLFESELFGHRKGAFTGAVKDYPGKFVLADGGTIFLDEIGDLPFECQAKLLRVLETGEVETLGAVERQVVDVRVVCATNRNLEKLVSEGTFREDLYYRISVLRIEVPPLRKRLDDIPALAGEFLRRFDPSGRLQFSGDALATLASMDYPGNVRQLKNMIERITILLQHDRIEASDILAHNPPAETRGAAGITAASLSEKLRSYEKELIRKTLEDCGNNISSAAKTLGMDRANLSKKIKELGLKKN